VNDVDPALARYNALVIVRAVMREHSRSCWTMNHSDSVRFRRHRRLAAQSADRARDIDFLRSRSEVYRFDHQTNRHGLLTFQRLGELR
jgi:hypothetical protein